MKLIYFVWNVLVYSDSYGLVNVIFYLELFVKDIRIETLLFPSAHCVRFNYFLITYIIVYHTFECDHAKGVELTS